MSIAVLDWRRIETGTPSGGPGAEHPAAGREAVHRSALARYLADYERHLATKAVGKSLRRPARTPNVLRLLACDPPREA